MIGYFAHNVNLDKKERLQLKHSLLALFVLYFTLFANSNLFASASLSYFEKTLEEKRVEEERVEDDKNTEEEASLSCGKGKKVKKFFLPPLDVAHSINLPFHNSFFQSFATPAKGLTFREKQFFPFNAPLFIVIRNIRL
ncbi:MAG: hypothetical protein SFU27_03625 [Thermonemataceae bacterium]|nr:hypothetical protein [Thermonemataceae bacterium]